MFQASISRLLLAALLLPALADAQQASRVRTATPEPATFGERFSLSGSLSAEQTAELSPRVDGLVSEVLVDVGSEVRAGQVLLRLDRAVAAQAALRLTAEAAQAQVAVSEAERLLAETTRLVSQQFVPASQVDTRAAELALLRAALASARAAEREQAELVQRHDLPAPFSGLISARGAEPGEWVQRGVSVLSLLATDRLRVDLQVPQERYAQITKTAEITVFAHVGETDGVPGKVRTKLPVTDPTARTFLLRVDVDDPDGRLLAGTSVRVEISLPPAEAALAVSRDALLRQPDGSYSLFVVLDDGQGQPTARLRSVRVLRDQGNMVAVSEGIVAGEEVVIRGNEGLRDGQIVQRVED